jgi:uncharacterized protein (DUF1697 family)
MGPRPLLALLRAVNVGGLTLPMEQLRSIAEGLGWSGVRSYIASGNLLFQAEGAETELAIALEGALRDQVGARIPVLVLEVARLKAMLQACPWSDAPGKSVHGLLLFGPVQLQVGRLEELREPSESLEVGEGVVWLHTPEGYGRSRLAAKLEQAMKGGPWTARNLNTLRSLAALSHPA